MVDIEISDSSEGIEHLKTEWNNLYSECGNRNIFISYNWIYNWFKTGKDDFRPFIITGRDKGKLVSVLPCSIKSGTIYPAGYPESDFIDVISINGFENPFLEQVCLFLSDNTSKWDIVYIKTVTEHSHLCNYFIRNKSTLNTIAELIPFSKCLIAEFQKGWNYYLNCLSPKFRSNLRRREKIAIESGVVSLAIYNSGDIDENILSKVVSINLKGRKAENMNAFFQNSRHKTFFSKIIKAKLCPDMFVAILSIGETAVAYKICFRADNEVWEYNTSFIEEYKRASPGLLLTARLFEKLSETGVKKYNFLKGDESYKINFTTYYENLHILVLRNKSFKSMIKYFTYIRLRLFLNRFDILRNIYDRLTD